MPAFQLKQFQQQLSQLLRLFALPTEFHQHLTHLFERYEQPSYRYGVGVKAPPEPAYHIQSVMLNEIENELNRMAEQRPRSAVLLARECWGDSYFETRRIAAMVMGAAPLFDLLFFQETFLSMVATSDKEYQELLFLNALKQFRQEQFSQLVEWIADWLASDDTVVIGFSAIQSLVDADNMDHLPTIYRLIEPFVISGDASYQEDVLHLLDGLVKLSPMETAHFLSELTHHFYGNKRMKYFRALCRSFEKPQRDFINHSFMDPSAFYHEEDILDE